MSLAPDAAVPSINGRLRNVDQGIRPLELPGASNVRTSQWVERCQGCSNLDGVVGRIIIGLKKLQTELLIMTGSSRELQAHLVCFTVSFRHKSFADERCCLEL